MEYISLFLNERIYRTIEETYTMTGGYRDGNYLIKKPSESEHNYDIRRVMAQPVKILKNVVENKYLKIFSQPIKRHFENIDWQAREEVEIFVKSVDNKGTTINEFMRRGAELLSLFDFVFLVGDNFDISEIEGLTRREMLEQRKMPFFQWVAPYNVDYDSIEFDNFGRMTAFSYFLYIYNPDYKMDFKIQKTITQTDIEIKTLMYINENGTITEEAINENSQRLTVYDNVIEHDFADIPVYLLSMQNFKKVEDLKKHNPSTFTATKLSFVIYNQRSDADNTLMLNNFALFILPVKDNERPSSIDTNNYNAILTDGTIQQPQFLAPPLDPVVTTYEIIKQRIEELYREEGLSYITGQISQSGIAKYMDNEEKYTMLAFIALKLQEAEYWLFDTFFDWQGYEKQEYTIAYKIDYTINDVMEQLERLKLILDLGGDKIEELNKELLKIAIDYLNISDQKKNKLWQIIENSALDRLV